MKRYEFCGPRQVITRCETNHPLFGFVRNLNEEPHVCSRCCHEVPEEHIPLMLFGDGEAAWVYCGDCEGIIFNLTRAIRERAKERRATP